MGRFSDSPYFLLRAFFDGLDNTKPIEVPTTDFEWDVKFISSFANSDERIYTDTPNYFDDDQNITDSVIFTNYDLNVWNLAHQYDPNLAQTFNSYIVAPFVNISGKGGGIMDLFVKEEDEGYQPITVRYDHRDGNEFHFINSGVKEYDAGPWLSTLTEEPMYLDGNKRLLDVNDTRPGDKFVFTFYDKIAKDTFNLFENDREAYFRKDSLYHDFLRIYAKDMMLEELGVELDIRNYVNTDKLFSFFHRIYKSHDLTRARVIFDGMKDYVMRAVPEHQRTPNFTELCNIFFDQLYQEIFDLLKNVWSLIDPMEVDERYLGYLSRYYDMFDVDIETASILHVREFIRDMIWMIKRKGTYTEFYILWRILTATKNILSVYERWHRKDVEMFPQWPDTISPPCTGTWPNYPYYSDTQGTTNVPPSAYFDYMYVYRPEYESPTIEGGAGPGWYNKDYPVVYNDWYDAPDSVHCPSGTFMSTSLAPTGDNYMLSTMYILETDISSEPLAPNEILTKDIWDTMNKYWEYIRPVNRVSDYRIVESPITDISGKYIHLYEVTSKSSAFLQTKSGISLDLLDGAYVEDRYSDNPRVIWTINHNLGDDVLLQCFDSNLDEIVPKEIEYLPNIANITWNSAEAGFAIVRRADWARTRSNPVSDNVWTFYHMRLQKEIIVHYKFENDRMYIDNTYLYEYDPLSVGTELPDHVDATFADLNNNTAMVGSDVKIFYNNTAESVWEVMHDIGIKGVIMSVYDFENNRIHPSRYNLQDSDSIIIEFDEPTAGYCVILAVGDLSIDDLLDELESLIESVTWIAYTHDNNGNRIEVDRGDVLKVYKDDNFYYFDFELDKAAEYIVNEIDLFDKTEDVLFHSLMSNLYKPPGVDLTFHYRLSIPNND